MLPNPNKSLLLLADQVLLSCGPSSAAPADELSFLSPWEKKQKKQKRCKVVNFSWSRFDHRKLRSSASPTPVCDHVSSYQSRFSPEATTIMEWRNTGAHVQDIIWSVIYMVPIFCPLVWFHLSATEGNFSLNKEEHFFSVSFKTDFIWSIMVHVDESAVLV